MHLHGVILVVNHLLESAKDWVNDDVRDLVRDLRMSFEGLED